ncbi:MAG: helix-turn-helix transcriptional regulator [Candidatus Gastranaerophilales bacterium]|nr:helix-turn-helix transcriptional regulator [Candidatus Gastranaerophilales bacterium]
MKILLPKLLASKKMTQAELARLTHIRPSTVCGMYNNNCSFVKLEHIEKICKALNCGVGDLIRLENK